MSSPTVLRLRGELGLAGAPALREELMAAIREGGSGPLVLDMSQVPFIDAAGVGVLLGARKRLAADGRELRVAALHKRVDRTLAIMGLHQTLAIYATVEDALAPTGEG